MKLFYSPTSPFVRQVMVVAHETGLLPRIELMPTAAVPIEVNAALSASNPLQKVPTLITDGGEALFDSRVICEYLDSLHDGRKLFPPAGGARWKALAQLALADGILDAGILCLYEGRYRPEAQRSPDWVAGQVRKINQGVDALEKSADELGRDFGIGEIAIACTLGWLEFRKPAGENRPGRSRLFAWFDAVSARPSLAATTPKG